MSELSDGEFCLGIQNDVKEVCDRKDGVSHPVDLNRIQMNQVVTIGSTKCTKLKG